VFFPSKSSSSPRVAHPLSPDRLASALRVARTSAVQSAALAPYWFGAPAMTFCPVADLHRRRPCLRGPHAAGRRRCESPKFRSCSSCSRSAFHPRDSASAPSVPVAVDDPRLAALSWDSLPFNDLSSWQRLTPGLPHPATLRPQVFTTSRRLIPPRTLQPYFMPLPLLGFHLRRLPPSRSPSHLSADAPHLDVCPQLRHPTPTSRL